MMNNEMMTLNLERIKVIDLTIAIQNVIFDLENDIRSDKTSGDRKRIAQASIDNKWRPLLENINNQFEEQDI